MPQATAPNTTTTSAPPSRAAETTKVRLGWWEERAIGYNVPQPNELIIHAVLYFPDDVMLDTPEALERVIKSYVALCRETGYWAHHNSPRDPFTQSRYSGYRHRLREYRACLAYYLRQSTQSGAPTAPSCASR